MKEITRTPAPEWLDEKWEKWGQAWSERYLESQKSSDFRWHQHKGMGYHDLLERLSEMTKRHCSFCDAYPMGRRIQHTVEHFRPKTKWPLLAYKWDNLFLCCSICQAKGDNFDEKLLRPDHENYDFDKFFMIDWSTGELLPNAAETLENQERANITIKLYKLNQNGKPEDRLEELEKFCASENPDIDQWSYRFLLERGGK